jgi:hypothetical protein
VTWQEVLKVIGRIVYTVFRCCFIVFIAIILGGMRGASKAHISNGGSKD